MQRMILGVIAAVGLGLAASQAQARDSMRIVIDLGYGGGYSYYDRRYVDYRASRYRAPARHARAYRHGYRHGYQHGYRAGYRDHRGRYYVDRGRYDRYRRH